MTQTPTDALRLAAVHDWIRDDVPLNVKMTIMPHHIDNLLDRLSAAAPASPLPGGGDWIDGTPEVPVGSPTWCGWASYEIRRLRSELPAAPTGDA